MKAIMADTVCPCGARMNAPIRKPKRFEPSVAKITCNACDSRFLFITRVGPRDKDGRFVCKSHFEIIELTELAKGKLLPKGQNPICEITTRPGEDGPRRETGADPAP